MMKYLRYLVLLVIGCVLITVALANRELVTLQALPSDIAEVARFNAAIEVPLFVVAFGGVLFGLLIGFVWEWLREHRYRSIANAKTREVERLERVVAANVPAATHTDDVLALLDAPKKVS